MWPDIPPFIAALSDPQTLTVGSGLSSDRVRQGWLEFPDRLSRLSDCSPIIAQIWILAICCSVGVTGA